MKIYEFGHYMHQMHTFEVEGETEKFWRIKGHNGNTRREEKKPSRQFKTFEECRAALIQRLNIDLRAAESRVLRLRADLARAQKATAVEQLMHKPSD